MQILVVEPGKTPVITEIGGSLNEMQKIVGGTIQAVFPFPEEVALVCNDEGKILGLPMNRGLRDERGNMHDIVYGTFFLCGAPSDSDKFDSLSPEQLARFTTLYCIPETFMQMDAQIINGAINDGYQQNQNRYF